jgi:sugar phosphate isomerase/epimerase
VAAPGIAVQIFSLREEAKADYPGTLRQIAGLGYAAYEAAFGYGGLPASELKRLFDELGLRVASSHVGSARLRGALDEEVEFNLAIGNRDLVCAELPIEDRTDEPAFHRWAETLGTLARRCRELGARLNYHSHAFEFRRFGGQTGLEILLEGAGADLGWEPDVYWINYAGEDPAAWIGRYADRCRLIHLKDMKDSPKPADPIAQNATDLKAYLAAPLGDGTLDFAPALKAATAAEWLIVEQDFADGPMLDALARGRQHLHSLI